MPCQTNAMNIRARALHAAAAEMEALCEFNDAETATWTRQDQIENAERITRARELRDRAHAAERGEW